MEHISKKTSQNISDALKEIGELSCMFYLYYHFNDKGWSVYRNFDEKGYDILLFNKKTGKKIKIEVKTRQRLISSASKRFDRNAHFTLTELEKKEADYLIGFWLEHNLFFIVPTDKLKKTKSNNKSLYKLIVKINRLGELDDESKKYLDWKIIQK